MTIRFTDRARRLAGLAAAAAAVLALAGCGGGAASQTGSAEPTPAATAASQPADSTERLDGLDPDCALLTPTEVEATGVSGPPRNRGADGGCEWTDQTAASGKTVRLSLSTSCNLDSERSLWPAYVSATQPAVGGPPGVRVGTTDDGDALVVAEKRRCMLVMVGEQIDYNRLVAAMAAALGRY